MPKHVRTLKAKRRARLQPVIARLIQMGEATANALGISPVEALNMEQENLIRRVATVQTGRRGRPAIVWAPTYKARRRQTA